MEYTIKNLGKLAGVSTRTLRYYDEIDLLKPGRINSSGYRIYGAKEVDRLQQILFYRELGVSLESIKDIVTDSAFNYSKALHQHHEKLLERREQLNRLISNVEQTLLAMEGKKIMSDKEKFEGFKHTALEENERKYCKEIREKYGDEVVTKSNQKFMSMTQEQHEAANKLAEDIIAALLEGRKTGDPACEKAQQAAAMHKEWLCLYWNEYSKEAHAGLGQMYVDDERFRVYYDRHKEGLAEFLRDAINIFTQ